MQSRDKAESTRNLVWDSPVRLSHALFALAFGGAFIMAKTSDQGWAFAIHMVLGLLMVAVVLFRVVWGFVGGRYARFAHFSWKPAALVAYLTGVLTGRDSRHVGHNPATSYAVVVMFLLALGIGASGLLMSRGAGEQLEEVHELLVFTLLGVALLHVAGVAVHLLRHRDDLVLSMIDGKKAVASADSAARPAWGAAVVLAALAAGILGLGLAGYEPNNGAVVIPGIGWQLGASEHEEHGERGHRKPGERRGHHEHEEHEDDD